LSALHCQLVQRHTVPEVVPVNVTLLPYPLPNTQLNSKGLKLSSLVVSLSSLVLFFALCTMKFFGKTRNTCEMAQQWPINA
jgi:hypothetical protein